MPNDIEILRAIADTLDCNASDQDDLDEANVVRHIADKLEAARTELATFRRDYALFEELSPPNMPRAQFVKLCFDAWETGGKSMVNDETFDVTGWFGMLQTGCADASEQQQAAAKLEQLQAIVTGCHEAIGESDASDADTLPETIRQIVTDLRDRQEAMEIFLQRGDEARVELEAIVDKLPKCWRLTAQGQLVQDAPVVPGGVVFKSTSFRGHECVDEFIVDSQHIETAWCMFAKVNVIECYSTRKAAEAVVKQQEQADGDET